MGISASNLNPAIGEVKFSGFWFLQIYESNANTYADTPTNIFINIHIKLKKSFSEHFWILPLLLNSLAVPSILWGFKIKRNIASSNFRRGYQFENGYIHRKKNQASKPNWPFKTHTQNTGAILTVNDRLFTELCGNLHSLSYVRRDPNPIHFSHCWSPHICRKPCGIIP